MKTEENSNKRLGAVLLMAVLAIAVVSTTTIAFSQGGESEEQEEEEEENGAATEVSIEVEDNELEIEIEVEGGFEDGEYNIVVDCETMPEGVEGPVVSGTLIVEDGKGEAKLEAELVAGEYADCTLTFGEFSQEVAGFTITAEVEAQELETEEEVEEEIDVEATIVGTSSLAKVKVEFTSSSTDKESLLEEILVKIKLDEVTVSNALKIETEEEELQEKLKVKVKIEDGKAEVEFEYRFVIDSTDRETIVNAIVDKLRTLELDEADIELKVEVKAEAEVKGEYKARATKAAKEARQAAHEKGKPEVVENIGHAERYFGKADKAVVALKIGLESDDIESISFGSAQLILIKFGEQEPKFRAVINILTDTQFDTLTACLDGDSIGELEIIPTSEELGLYIGHLRETLTGVSISIPGVTAYVVEGADCSATPILSGSI